MTVERNPSWGKSSSNGAAHYDDWKMLAEKTLKGGTISSLDYTNEDGITHPALMTSAEHHLAMSDGLAARGARGWVIAQYLEPKDDVAALNAMLLDELEGGTERVIFTIDQQPEVIPSAMTGIMAEAVFFSFDAPERPVDCVKALMRIWGEQKTPSNLARGHLGVDAVAAQLLHPPNVDVANLRQKIDDLMPMVADWPKLGVFTLGGGALHRFGLTSAEEIAANLSHMTAILRQMEDAGYPPRTAIRRVEFQLAMDADLYGNIAKSRAARLLLDRYYAVLGLDVDGIAKQIHGVTSDRMLSRLDLDSNMLRSGTAMLAMALSGVGVMTCLPHDWLLGSSRISRRIARNSHHILADEAHLNHVADPAHGSYFIDAATTKLAAQSWRLFQKLEACGGVFSPSGMAMLDDWADAAAAKRQTLINQGHDALLGLTIHPMRDVEVMPKSWQGVGGVRGGGVRPAKPWEDLRESFTQILPRCLILDMKVNQTAILSAISWFAAVGIDAIVMTPKTLEEAKDVIASARPDIMVLNGGDSDIDTSAVKVVIDAGQFTPNSAVDIQALMRQIYKAISSQKMEG